MLFFILGLEEASEAYEEYQQKFLSTDSKPAFRHIRVSFVIVSLSQTFDAVFSIYFF